MYPNKSLIGLSVFHIQIQLLCSWFILADNLLLNVAIQLTQPQVCYVNPPECNWQEVKHVSQSFRGW